MPHLILQQSNNVHNLESKEFFKKAQTLLVEKLPTQLASCKSRLIVVDDFLIANGSPDMAFVHLEVAVLSGRSSNLLTEISMDLYNLLFNHLNVSNGHLDLQISVEVRDLSEHYYKG